MRIYITCEGGVVQAVSTDTPALEGVEYVIIDYDAEGADDVTEVLQSDGSIAEAVIAGGVVDRLEVKIDNLAN